VLDEFFRTGRYRVRPPSQVAQTSSPSMDISNASNFERFVFDLCGRDAAMVKRLWNKIDAGGEFNLAGTPCFANINEYGFVSGSSTRADRLATFRRVYKD
jgi:threonine synthase